MGLLQSIFGDNPVANTTRVFLHSAGAGIPEWAGRHFGDPAAVDRTDQLLAQSRQNTGFAGSLANAAGYVAPGAALLKGARLVPAAFRAAPAAARAIPAAERAVASILPQSSRAIVRARLGLPELPTISETLGRNIASVVKSHPVVSALTALGIGGGALADYGGSPTAAASPAPKGSAPKATAKAPAAKAAEAAAPVSPLDQLIGAVAKSQGGKLSLNQLAAIGDFTSKVQPDIRHPPTYKDRAADNLAAISEQRWQQTQAAAKALMQKGDVAGAQALLNQGMDNASRDYATILGQDPQNLLLAQRMQEMQGN